MEKNILKYIIFYGLAALSVLSSCKDSFLDQKPYTGQPPEAALATEKDIYVALTGAYASLRVANVNISGTSTNISAYGRNIPAIGDVAADNVFVSASNTGRYLTFNQYTFNQGGTEFRDIWLNLYATIMKANRIIDSELSESDNVKKYKGEAYAIRALCYFDLVRHFAKPYTDDPNSDGVPLSLHYDPFAKPARSKVAEVYTQILSDLEQSYNMISTYRGTAYFSKYAARALAAKVNLYKGDYEAALSQAQDVIRNSGFSLVTNANLISYWGTTSAQSSTKTETLFEVVSDGVANLGNDELGYVYNQAGYGDLLATPELYNLYSDTDLRKQLITVGARTNAEKPAYIVTKYKAMANDRDDKKILRLSEVYLIAAESSHSQAVADDALALTYLNTLMAQRDPNKVYSSTGNQLLEDIIMERRKELAFEGDRLHTLNRLKRDIVRSAVYPSAARNISYSNTRRIFPIPLAERTNNPNISQNPGYN